MNLQEPNLPSDFDKKLAKLGDPKQDGPAPSLGAKSSSQLIDQAIDHFDRGHLHVSYRSSSWQWPTVFVGGALAVAVLLFFILVGDGSTTNNRESQRHADASLTATDSDDESGDSKKRQSEKSEDQFVKNSKDRKGILATREQPSGMPKGVQSWSSAEANFEWLKNAVKLKHGRLTLFVDPDLHDGGFEVLVPEGRVRVTGTVFSVEVFDVQGEEEEEGEQAFVVSVYRGSVEILSDSRTIKLAKDQMYRSGWSANRQLSQWYREQVAGDLGAPQSSEFFNLVAGNEIEQRDGTVQRNSSSKSKRNSREGNLSKISDEQSAKPNLQKEYLQRANELRSQKRWQDARELYLKSAKQAPGSSLACIALLSAASLESKPLKAYRDALEHYQQFERECGNRLKEDALKGKIEVLTKLGRRSEEIEHRRRFLRFFPNSLSAPNVGLALARALAKQGQCSSARKHFHRLLSNPKTPARIKAASTAGLRTCEEKG